MNRNVTIIEDTKGEKIVMINNIHFSGKRLINWDNVKDYLKAFVGNNYRIENTADIIYIGNDLPNEYTGSVYTYKLKGAAAKAKANAVQGLPEIIKIAVGKHFRKNNSEKHYRNAAFGWYRYDSRFALPVYGENKTIERYNVYHASLLVRHDENGKMYLYDILDIKKETGNPLEPSKTVHDKKPASL